MLYEVITNYCTIISDRDKKEGRFQDFFVKYWKLNMRQLSLEETNFSLPHPISEILILDLGKPYLTRNNFV